jgi:hypothetical protein
LDATVALEKLPEAPDTLEVAVMLLAAVTLLNEPVAPVTVPVAVTPAADEREPTLAAPVTVRLDATVALEKLPEAPDTLEVAVMLLAAVTLLNEPVAPVTVPVAMTPAADEREPTVAAPVTVRLDPTVTFEKLPEAPDTLEVAVMLLAAVTLLNEPVAPVTVPVAVTPAADEREPTLAAPVTVRLDATVALEKLPEAPDTLEVAVMLLVAVTLLNEPVAPVTVPVAVTSAADEREPTVAAPVTVRLDATVALEKLPEAPDTLEVAVMLLAAVTLLNEPVAPVTVPVAVTPAPDEREPTLAAPVTVRLDATVALEKLPEAPDTFEVAVMLLAALTLLNEPVAPLTVPVAVTPAADEREPTLAAPVTVRLDATVALEKLPVAPDTLEVAVMLLAAFTLLNEPVAPLTVPVAATPAPEEREPTLAAPVTVRLDATVAFVKVPVAPDTVAVAVMLLAALTLLNEPSKPLTVPPDVTAPVDVRKPTLAVPTTARLEFTLTLPNDPTLPTMLDEAFTFTKDPSTPLTLLDATTSPKEPRGLVMLLLTLNVPVPLRLATVPTSGELGEALRNSKALSGDGTRMTSGSPVMPRVPMPYRPALGWPPMRRAFDDMGRNTMAVSCSREPTKSCGMPWIRWNALATLPVAQIPFTAFPEALEAPVAA